MSTKATEYEGNIEDGFTRAWAEAPQSYKRLVEMETAEFFYLLGVRDGHAHAAVTINADLKEAVRVAQETVRVAQLRKRGLQDEKCSAHC